MGAGTMGKLHARVISQSEEFSLVGVIDSNEQLGKQAADLYESRWLPSLPDLSDIDAVVVATPTEAHFDISKFVLESQTALLVEKPITNNFDQTIELIELARSNRTPLMCGLLERFNPAVITAMALIDQPQYFSSRRHSPYAPRIKTGVAWDLLIHDVDLAIRTLGVAPQQTVGSLSFVHPASHQDSEDTADATLTFDNGRMAHVSASRISQRKIRDFSIYELDRSIEVDLLRRDVTVFRHVSDQPADQEGRGYRQQTVIEIPELLTGTEPLVAQLSHFGTLIRGEKDFNDEISSLIDPHKVIADLLSDSRSL